MTPPPSRPLLHRARARTRSRALLRVLVHVPGCLVLACGLMLGAADTSASAATGVAPGDGRIPVLPGSDHPGSDHPGSDHPDTDHPGSDHAGTATLSGQVSPVDSEVAPAQNGDFTLTVTNTGTLTADNVRVLLDDGQEGNGVGSPDGRCLSRLDETSPADLWCELGDLAPRQSVVVGVHAYMFRCVWVDPDNPTSQLHAPAFHWRVAYTDGSQALAMNGPTPRWSC